MGKRSEITRKRMDFYATPYDATIPLFGHLSPKTKFCEPCAGEGHLIEHLERHGHQCVTSYDADAGTSFQHHDASFLTETDVGEATHIITNPPWSRPVLHQLIERFSMLRPTWLLFDADWAYTKQAKPFMNKCHKIVVVGRVKWFGNMVGKENCSWYLFDSPTNETRFYA